MLRTKHAFSAFCMLVAMTMATSAIAQNILSVSSGVEPRARENGQTELAGGITLRVENLSNTVGMLAHSGTLIIDYGVPITNRTAVIAGGDTGCFSGAIATYTGSMMTIAIGDPAEENSAPCTATSTIDISGVRLAIAGSGLDSAVEASISVDGDFRLESGGNRSTVINAVVDELTDRGVSNGRNVSGVMVLARHDGSRILGGHMAEDMDDEDRFVLTITENTVDAFNDTELELSFSGIPVGATITLDAWLSPNAGPAARGRPRLLPVRPEDSAATDDDESNTLTIPSDLIPVENADAGISDATVTAADNNAIISMTLGVENPDDFMPGDFEVDTGGVLTNAIDRITLRGYIEFADMDEDIPTEFPLADIDIDVTVSVGPEGSAFGPPPRRLVITDPPIRFAEAPVGPVTVIDIEADTSMLVAPYALSDGRFDTGFAISNMNTDDPTTEDTDESQAGAITFTLYQTGEDPVKYTTPDQLEAGGTYVVLLSEILLEAGVEAFQGYVEITTDFTGGDGVAYISDWAAFSATATLKAK